MSVALYAQNLENLVEAHLEKLLFGDFFSFEPMPKIEIDGVEHVDKPLRIRHAETIARRFYRLVGASVKIEQGIVNVNKYRHCFTLST